MALTVVQFRCLTDNYGVLVHDDESGATVSVDAPDDATIRGELDRRGWRLSTILTTHHHADHVAGNLALKEAFGCTIVGPAQEAAKIPGIDREVNEGAHLPLGGHGVLVLATPGHTLGHVSYFIAAARAVFVGDTLFAMGCGRLFEGTAEAMWGSLSRLRGLPDATTIYCGHDYAAANARFALTIEPHNAALTARAKDVAAIAAAGGLTPPTTIGLERATNPLLRADEPAVRARLRMTSAKAHEVFAEIRRRKDEFG